MPNICSMVCVIGLRQTGSVTIIQDQALLYGMCWQSGIT